MIASSLRHSVYSMGSSQNFPLRAIGLGKALFMSNMKKTQTAKQTKQNRTNPTPVQFNAGAAGLD